MALAYLLSKASGKFLNVNFSIPLVLFLSIIPDIDIIFEFLLKSDVHRGPTHSIITAALVFIPFLMVYGQKVTPYFVALASHSLIGDFVIGGQIQLLWPLSTSEFGLPQLGLSFPYVRIDDPISVALEFTLFIIAVIFMFKTRDIYRLLRNSKFNLVLAIPIFTVLLPTFAGYPLRVPILLVLPHLFYLVVFSISVLVVATGIFK